MLDIELTIKLYYLSAIEKIKNKKFKELLCAYTVVIAT